ncbi:hypothetical protein [Nocardiopsis sp. L17-MgMaSL7]|uniref:hypothetical protein n=1 Tax=Nocardiopsis sp. L17-MgMaSL7 TaxID=1938893 RepID=UPI000D719A27|nr:hypothetical protein [Nocardiopsis sp. L17-MgMaSL7]PWV50018.1 hypothetical protein BDW27_10853 [Nocardiopsis sp. L17-MgMaSL7]
MNNETLDRLRLPGAWVLLGALGVHMLAGLISVIISSSAQGYSFPLAMVANGGDFFGFTVTLLLVVVVGLVLTSERTRPNSFPVILTSMILVGVGLLFCLIALISGFIDIRPGEGGMAFAGFLGRAAQGAVLGFFGFYLIKIFNDPTVVPRAQPQQQMYNQQPFPPATGAQQSFAPAGYPSTDPAVAQQQAYGYDAAAQQQAAYGQDAAAQQQAAYGYDVAGQQAAYGQDAAAQQQAYGTGAQQAYGQDAAAQQQAAYGYDASGQQAAYGQDAAAQQQAYGTGAQQAYGQDAAAQQQAAYGYDASGQQAAYGQDAAAQQQAYGYDTSGQPQAYNYDASGQQAAYGQDAAAQQQAYGTGAQQAYGQAYDPSQYAPQPAVDQQAQDAIANGWYQDQGQQGQEAQAEPGVEPFFNSGEKSGAEAADQSGGAYGNQYGSGSGYGSDQQGQGGTDGQQNWYGNDGQR